MGVINCLVQQGRTGEALARLKIADAITLAAAEHPGLLRDHLDMMRADIAIQMGAFDRAERQLAGMSERRPALRPKLFSLLAQSRGKQGDFRGALAFNAQAIAAFNDKVPIGNRDTLKFEKSKYLFHTGDVMQAATLLDALLNRQPPGLGGVTRAAAIRLTTEISFAQGKKNVALKLLQDAKEKTESALSINSQAFKEIEELERRWR